MSNILELLKMEFSSKLRGLRSLLSAAWEPAALRAAASSERNDEDALLLRHLVTPALSARLRWAAVDAGSRIAMIPSITGHAAADI